MKALIFCSIFSLGIGAPLSSSTLHVPAEYATIQSAIDAANPEDVVQIEAGVYHELLSINKSIALNGADQETCIISDTSETFPIVAIHADSVTLSNLEINGGYFNGDFNKAGPSPRGILAQDTHLKLDHIRVKMIRNYMIEANGGSCQIDVVALSPDIDYSPSVPSCTWTELALQKLRFHTIAKAEKLAAPTMTEHLIRSKVSRLLFRPKCNLGRRRRILEMILAEFMPAAAQGSILTGIVT